MKFVETFTEIDSLTLITWLFTLKINLIALKLEEKIMAVLPRIRGLSQ